jgi:hypothetical protein
MFEDEDALVASVLQRSRRKVDKVDPPMKSIITQNFCNSLPVLPSICFYVCLSYVNSVLIFTTIFSYSQGRLHGQFSVNTGPASMPSYEGGALFKAELISILVD